VPSKVIEYVDESRLWNLSKFSHLLSVLDCSDIIASVPPRPNNIVDDKFIWNLTPVQPTQPII